ncbi:MAG TPA: TonB-dependent receptor [Thermoanaerobaculales bacterium]|nr:TonB-dependent receptor [Thermoanaerobaculales bacterium]
MRMTILIGLVLAVAATAAAQGSVTGSVRGTVTDPDGAGLPGVAVTASSAVLITGQQTTVTDEGGNYRFPSLPPGSYVIEASLAGMKTARQEGVRVSLGQALAVDLAMTMAEVAGEIVVTGGAPLVSVVANSVSTSFGDDFLTTQPLPRNYYNIIRSAPGVNMDYFQSSGSAMLAYGGTEERQNAFTLDGVNVADAGAGQHWILPAIQWFQEIQVGGLGAPAEYGGFTGGIINGVTKSGGNEFHGEAEVYYQPASWTADNDPETDNDEFKFYDAALSIGGPLAKDKLWYFTSLEYWNQVTTPYGATDTSDRKIPRFLGKLTLQASDATRLMAMVEYEGLENERRGIAWDVLPEASSKQDAPGWTVGLNWESLVNSNNFFNVKATGYDGRDDYLPYNGPDVPARIDYYDTEVTWNNATTTELNYRRVLTLDGSWSLFKDGWIAPEDSHSFKFGVLFEQARSSDVWFRNGGFTYYDDSTMCDSLEAYFADPSCAVSTDASIYRGDGEYNAHPEYSGLALFAQDSVRIKRLTINLGLRYGAYDAGWQDGHGDSSVYDDDFFDPRVGFVWDVFGNARTALKAHWGRYHEKMFTYMYDRELSGNAVVPTMDCYWSEDTQDYTDCTEPVAQMGTMGETEHPYADELLLSLEQQLGKEMVIGVDLIDRSFRSIMAMINTNEDYELWSAPGNPFGGDLPVWNLLSEPEFVLTTDAGGFRDYQAAILRFEKRYSRGWQLQTSIVWSDMDGNILKNNSYEAEWLDRNGFINADGQMEKYSEWEYKLSGSVDLPLNFQFGGQYTFLSGWYWTPYARIYELDYNSSTGNYIWLTPRGSQQLDDRSLLDLRLAWNASLGQTMTLTASLECFNVFNSDTVREVSARYANYYPSEGADGWYPRSSYGDPTDIESPRQIRAGLRLSF